MKGHSLLMQGNDSFDVDWLVESWKLIKMDPNFQYKSYTIKKL
jgi:hypothetical protein